MATVTFQLEVEVDEMFLADDASDEDVVEQAREIMATAPAFDGISDDVIAQLETEKVER